MRCFWRWNIILNPTSVNHRNFTNKWILTHSILSVNGYSYTELVSQFLVKKRTSAVTLLSWHPTALELVGFRYCCYWRWLRFSTVCKCSFLIWILFRAETEMSSAEVQLIRDRFTRRNVERKADAMCVCFLHSRGAMPEENLCCILQWC
jgi:hypothetical protein